MATYFLEIRKLYLGSVNGDPGPRKGQGLAHSPPQAPLSPDFERFILRIYNEFL